MASKKQIKEFFVKKTEKLSGRFKKLKSQILSAMFYCLETVQSFKKVVAVLTVTAFLFTSVFSQALHALAVTDGDITRQVKLTLDGLTIPYSLGRITDGRCFDSDKVVINIQDLHCHSEVQRNISRILELLDEKYHLNKVYIEGSAGNIDTSWVNLIENKALREKIINTFVEAGRISGTEYYSIKANKPHLLVGIENNELYKENVLRLGKIIESQKEIQAKMPQVKQNLSKLREKYFEKGNEKLDELTARYSQGKISSEKYYKLLTKYADKQQVNLSDFPNINEYLVLIKEQRHINYKKVSKQLTDLINQLKEKMPYATYKFLLEKTKDLSHMDQLYSNLLELSNLYKINLEYQFPELNKFLGFVKSNQNINPLELVSEERGLIRELHYSFSKTIAEQEVAFISDFYSFLESYLENKISAKDYAFYT
ncbi:MAG: hypothetical protein NT145_05865, partial [Elusimicrobia bacterium]|nr:hypothetical protein [Elusimicrobiota bacterium]